MMYQNCEGRKLVKDKDTGRQNARPVSAVTSHVSATWKKCEDSLRITRPNGRVSKSYVEDTEQYLSDPRKLPRALLK